MTSPISLIVLGQAYFFAAPPNTLPTATAPNPIQIPHSIQTRSHPTSIPHPEARRPNYTYTPGIGSHKFHAQAVAWNEARLICLEEGGHLAIINSKEEAKAIAEIFKAAPPVAGAQHPNSASIGFHSLYGEKQFATIHGETLEKAGYDQWDGGNPSIAFGGHPENCGAVTNAGLLNDIDCNAKFGFICEIPI